jgi:hypothetical protein
MKLAIATGALALLGLLAYGYASPDLSGVWLIEYHDDNGVEIDHPKLLLQQSGNQLSGKFGVKDWAVTGRILANHVEFSYTGYASDGREGKVNAQAFIQSSSRMTGRMMSPLNGGTFTAAKQ